ncbi:MAG: D-glycerate dehydrogenase [Candidatus Heimdallarchaeota archaeon]|nr:D-glycerate dehydrogenase [Candidatus Heimdallarchaeota archaeon]
MEEKYKVFLTRKIPKAALELLPENVELTANEENRVLTKEEIIEGVKGKDGLICLLTDKIDEEVIEAAGEQLKIIANYAVGYNNIDVEAATKRKIPVTNTPGVLTETTADLAFGLLMAIGRRIVESDKFTRAGKFKGWGPLLQLGTDIHGKTLGIIGCGRIGSAVARRAKKGFNMKVLYYNNKRNEKLEEELGVEYAPFEELLEKADYVSLHVPLTEKTKHMISEKEFKKMKKTAYLINTSRGAVVNEKELLKALKRKEIAGAALDVYEKEPEITKGLEKMDNVILTAHIGSATKETRTKMGEIAIKNLLQGLRGEKPDNCINKEIYA